VDGWQDSYRVLEDGTVVCRLRLRIGEDWITKTDVGGPSEQGDSGDQRKAAFSDALKRAAVKFGIGRYLYRLPTQWVDYDGHKKQFAQTPKLPPFAIPKLNRPAAAADSAPPAADARKTDVRKQEAVNEKQAEVKKAEPAEARKTELREADAAETSSKAGQINSLPANGLELQRRLYEYDARLAKQGLWAQGALVKSVVEAGVKAGYDGDLSTWSGPAIHLAAEATRTFEAQAREEQQTRPKVA
jgi:hypothetical protein